MMMDVKVSTLPNGIRVVTSAIPRVESVTLGIWVGVGARFESMHEAGASHFIEHLLFKGTRNRSSVEISQAIEGSGGYLNAFTQEESTCFYARVVSEQAWTALDVLSDMYRHPLMAAVDVSKERGVILEEIAMYRDQPQHLVQEMLGEALWKGHPVGRPIIGYAKSLSGMSRNDVLRFKDRMYVPGATLVALAGKIDHGECVDKVRQFLGKAGKGSKPAYRRVTAAVRSEREALLKKDIEQTHLAFGFRHFGRHDSRRYALRVLNTVLGENMSSRLFQVVREKHGLAYSVNSSFQLLDDTGALIVSAGLDRKRHRKALELIVKELIRVQERVVGEAEFRRAKDYVIGQMKLGLESTSHQMMWVGDNLLSHKRFISPEETISMVDRVTPEQVRAVANQVLCPGMSCVSMVSPDISDRDKGWIRNSVARL